MMMHLSVAAAALLASCSAFAPKPLRGTPRRNAKRQSLQMNVITERPARAALAEAAAQVVLAAGGNLTQLIQNVQVKILYIIPRR